MARTDIKVCEGMRKNGTCGNRYNTENLNKKCAGRNCPFRFGAYVTKDGGGYIQPANYATIQKQKEMDKKFGVVVPEVVDEKVGKDIARREDAAQRTVIKKAIGRQVQVVQGVELRSNFEKLKLGAMVSEAVRQLKLEDAQTGRGHAGGGALGWWDDVCPRDKDGAPVIAYKTVMQWKEAAERLPALIGGAAGVRALPSDKVMGILAKDPTKVVGKDAKILASAEKLANGMTMRQMLLWGGDAEPDRRGAKGRPSGTKADLTKKPDSNDALAAARALWSKIIVPADREAVALAAAARLLNAEDVENAKIVLSNLMDYLKEREMNLKIKV